MRLAGLGRVGVSEGHRGVDSLGIGSPSLALVLLRGGGGGGGGCGDDVGDGVARVEGDHLRLLLRVLRGRRVGRRRRRRREEHRSVRVGRHRHLLRLRRLWRRRRGHRPERHEAVRLLVRAGTALVARNVHLPGWLLQPLLFSLSGSQSVVRIAPIDFCHMATSACLSHFRCRGGRTSSSDPKVFLLLFGPQGVPAMPDRGGLLSLPTLARRCFDFIQSSVCGLRSDSVTRSVPQNLLGFPGGFPTLERASCACREILASGRPGRDVTEMKLSAASARARASRATWVSQSTILRDEQRVAHVCLGRLRNSDESVDFFFDGDSPLPRRR